MACGIAAAAPLGQVTTTALGHEASDIVSGPDGNLWFLDKGADRLGRMTPSGEVSYVPIPSSSPPSLTGLAAGSDRNLWTFISGENQLVRVTPQGSVTKYPFTPIGDVQGIATGPDGALWIGMTDSGVSPMANQFARVSPTTLDGQYFNAGTGWLISGMASASTGIAFIKNTGAEASLLRTDGTIDDIPGSGVSSGVAEGPSFTIWASDFTLNSLRKWTPGQGSSTAFPTDGNVAPGVLATGVDSMVWYWRPTPRTIARVNRTGGSEGIYSAGIPSTGDVSSLTAGSDGSMWFIANDTGADNARVVRVGTGVNQVARVTMSGSGVPGTEHSCTALVEADGLGLEYAGEWVWLADGSPIAGTRSSTYVPPESLAGRTLTCRAMMTFEIGLVQMGFTSSGLPMRAPAAAPSGGGAVTPGTTTPKLLKATWKRKGTKVTASFRPFPGASANGIRATRAKGKARAGTCRTAGKGKARRVTCAVTLPKGRWTVAAEARTASRVLARATKKYVVS